MCYALLKEQDIQPIDSVLNMLDNKVQDKVKSLMLFH